MSESAVLMIAANDAVIAIAAHHFAIPPRSITFSKMLVNGSLMSGNGSFVVSSTNNVTPTFYKKNIKI